MPMAFLGTIVGLALTLTTLTDEPGKVAEADRAQVETEATNQASQADRLFKAGQYQAALPLYEAERASRSALGDRRYEAYALRAMGCCRSALGDDLRAIAIWQEARKLDALRDDPAFEGYDWLLIGQAYLRCGRLSETVEAVTLSLPKLSKAIDNDHEADARLVLADALLQLDRPRDAARHLERAETLAHTLNDPRRLALSQLGSARVALATDQPGLAVDRADEALRTFKTLNAKGDAALASRTLGEAYADLGRLDAAVAPLEAAARDHETVKNLSAVADDLALLAAVRADAGDPAAAVATAQRVVKARRDASDPSGEVDALVAQASFQDQAKDQGGSAATLAEALSVARQEATPARLVKLLILASTVTRRAGQSAKADALLTEAEQTASSADNAALKRLVTEAKASLAR